MALERFDFDQLAEADLRELFDEQVPESLRLDYKRDLYTATDAGKKEFLKDVSAFANANGGHLIIGMDEAGGIPTGIPGVPGNPDTLVQQLEQSTRTAIDPSIQGIRIKAVPLAAGDQCLVLRIPKSWRPPHRVSFQGWNKFWIRNAAGAHEASMMELRSLFSEDADAGKFVRAFRDERVAIIAAGEELPPLVDGGRLILHIVPFSAMHGLTPVEPAAAHAYYLQQQRAFVPIQAQAYGPGFNLEGFIVRRAGAQNNGYTQVFRSGAVEATKAPIIHRDQRQVNAGDNVRQFVGAGIEGYVLGSLVAYLSGLRNLGVTPPLAVMLTLEGVQNAAYGTQSDVFIDAAPPDFGRNVVKLPVCIIEDYGTAEDIKRAVRPMIDALWNAAGHEKAATYNDNGIWIGFRPRG